MTTSEYGEQILDLVRALSVFLCASTSSNAANNACCVLQNLTEGNDDASAVEEVFRCGNIVAVLIGFAKHSTSAGQMSRKSYLALCVLCNLTGAASHAHLEDLLALDFLSLLKQFSNHPSSDAASKACNACSKLCARSPQMLQMVMDAGLIGTMTGLVSASSNSKVHSCAAYSLLSALFNANPQQMTILVKAGCLERIVSVLHVRKVNLDRVQLVCEALRCFKVLLTRTDFTANFDLRINKAGGWSQVKCLQRSSECDVRLLAKELEQTRVERNQVGLWA